MTRLDALEPAVEVALVAGLTISSLLLLGGLVFGAPEALRWGAILLMLTPIARVVVVAVGMFARGDWIFGVVSLWVLGVLATSVGFAFHH